MLVRHRLRPLSLSSIPIILHIYHCGCHHSPTSLLQYSSHHFTSSPCSSLTFLSHGIAFHSSLLVLHCLLRYNFIATSCSNFLTLVCYYLSTQLFLLHSTPICSIYSSPPHFHHFPSFRFNCLRLLPSALSDPLCPLCSVAVGCIDRKSVVSH